ncbi:hypothetical protein ACFSJY_13370 [Thalassotalea euphylliae]|uniref:hypothetical protein n=1 Tax=Thalassotalea euphylliae TaxID=1655234 RepID=UPI0036430F6F
MSISDKQLQQHIDQLDKEISPERELWTGIEKAIAQPSIEPKQGKQPWVPVAWAASIVAAVLLTWINVPGESQPSLAPSLVASLDANFQHEKQLMLASFGTPDLAKLPKPMQEELEKLASARASIEAALEEDENNTDLLNLLQWTQQQELELLKRLFTPQWQTI